MNNHEDDIEELKHRMSSVERGIEELRTQIETQYNNVSLIVKYVALPLIVILGGLVGIKIAFP